MKLFRETSLKKAVIIFLFGCLSGIISLEIYQHVTHVIPVPIASLPDGAIYDGELVNGVFEGQGRMRWPNGDFYSGEFENGLFHGQGRYERSSGLVYEGEFTEGEITGVGTLSYDADTQYTGELKAASMHGKGTLTTPGVYYEGQFVNDKYHGYGTLKMKNGNEYTGEFKQGKFEGEGTYTHRNKGIYSGTFVGGRLTGHGRFTDEHGREYEGQFKDWEFHGQGKLINGAGDQWVGQFEQGQPHGPGEYSGEDGEYYRGQFKYGEYHGKGELTLPTGDHYRGEFRYGRYHGAGKLTRARPVDNVSEIKGTWQHGRLVEADKENLVVDIEGNNERALYNQHTLLQQQWQQLEENNPDAIDLYFLGISGDGTQSVFRREVLYVKDYFDKSLHTRGKSMVLINDKKTVAEFPLATRTSIRQTLQYISQRMDTENDILFIYMSSHGSETFDLMLKQEDMALPDLPAQTLADMLDALSIKWKVIIISACYSGGFIPVLRDDRTLIITAAESDATSFGCADDNEFTYFGEAMFKDALPETGSLLTAFERAKEIIRQREDEEGYEYSNPQIYKPEPIVNHLQAWLDAM